MLKLLLKLSMTTLAIAFVSSICVLAQGFTKNNEYKEGTFTDVPSNVWYAYEVKSAYELGFMNGKSDTAFVPDGNVTVAEGITMASRVHANYNGKTIAEKTGGKWYDMYVAYALENGLVADGQFTNYDRNIMRYEMAVMFAKAMPEGYFSAVNTIKDIPDVAQNEEYYDELMTLYKAGVVLGSDDYGNFYATNPIKRSETAAIINRVALPENRKKGALLEYAKREEAFYLIDDDDMVGGGTTGGIMLASAWKYENRYNTDIKADASNSNVLKDSSFEGGTYIHRDITTQKDGVIVLETSFDKISHGARVVFADSDGNKLFEITDRSSDGYFYAIGDNDVKTPFSMKKGKILLYAELDMDSRKAYVVINGTELGTYEMSSTAKDLSVLSFGTGKEETGNLTVNFCHMYKNYALNDTFRLQTAGQSPYNWNVTGTVKIEEMKCDTDYGIVKIDNAGTAVRSFETVADKFVFESFVMLDETQKGSVTLKKGSKDVFKIDIDGNSFVNNGSKLRGYTSGVWQLIRIEADTNTGEAVLKINNKKCKNVTFDADGVDTVEISATGIGAFRFDDVLVFNTFDYADYCPVPVPVTDDEWIVGMSVCSLWREGTHFGWDCVAPFDEATPVLGYYDEGIPEVNDWEIKFLVEHGYDYQHFCWYMGLAENAPIKQPRLGDSITDGYMNAKYSDMQDFCIMWENATVDKDITDVFYSRIWPYWVDWYFTDDRYLVIDNKPVLSIYRYDMFVTGFGGTEGAKKAVDFMRSEIKKMGFDDLIVVILNSGSSSTQNSAMKAMGADALLNYTFGEYSYDPNIQIEAMNKAFNNGGITLIPCISVGYNRVAWLGAPRYPYITPENFQKVMEWAKNEYMPKIAKRETEKTWISKMVFANTWNELGEGHYLIPANLNGFAYLDANRAVFSSVAGKNDNTHFDVEPTINQKARLGYLYPATSNRMKRTYWIQDDNGASANYEVVKAWIFDNPDVASLWKRAHDVSSLGYDVNEDALVGVSDSIDPSIVTAISSVNAFNADEVDFIRVTIKCDSGKNSMQFFFINDNKEAWSGKKQTPTVSVKAGDYDEYLIDVRAIANWNGTITGLRFDPMSSAGTFSIKSIELLKEDKKNNLTLTVDGTSTEYKEGFFEVTDKEIYVAGNPDIGFYNLHNFYYVWNRWNGELYFKTSDDVEFEFKIGSDKARVNGVEKQLYKKVEVIDGLVVLPLKFIYDNCKIEYSVEGNVIDVNVRTAGYKDIIDSRVPYEYEFNVPGDVEGWKISNCNGSVTGGVMVLNAEPLSNGRTDPQMTLQPKFNSKKYNKIDIRFKADFADPETALKRMYIYFATTAESNLNEAKKLKMNYDEVVADKDGYYTVTFDCSENEKWTDTITMMRLDPGDYEGVYTIDYIRMWGEYNPTAEDTYFEKRDSLLAEADEGKPFHVANFNAEDKGIPMMATSGSGKISIIEDDLKEGNHAYYIEAPKDSDTKKWMYFVMPTRFKPGVTYTVELDVRVMKDHRGNDVSGARVAWNMRYTDISGGELKGSVDHHKPFDMGMNTKDGWYHVSFTHTVAETSTDRSTDAFTIFANPQTNEDGTVNNISYMLDNIVVTVAE